MKVASIDASCVLNHLLLFSALSEGMCDVLFVVLTCSVQCVRTSFYFWGMFVGCQKDGLLLTTSQLHCRAIREKMPPETGQVQCDMSVIL